MVDQLVDKYGDSHGNEFYTPKALMMRESLQWDKNVTRAIDTLWYVTDIDKNGGIDKVSSVCLIPEMPHTIEIQAEYASLHKQMHKALHSKSASKWTPEMCEADWQRDRQGYGHLNYQSELHDCNDDV